MSCTTSFLAQTQSWFQASLTRDKHTSTSNDQKRTSTTQTATDSRHKWSTRHTNIHLFSHELKQCITAASCFGECVLITAKRIGGLHRFVGSVLSIAKHVGRLQMFGVCVLNTANCAARLQMFGEYVLTTAKTVGGLQSYVECIMTTAKRVGGMQRFGECVLTTVLRVRGLQMFGASVLTTPSV